MIRKERITKLHTDFCFDLFAPRERIVFLDIETTALKPRFGQIYLIGLLHFEDDHWKLTQFFAEKKADEPELVSAFSCFIGNRLKGQDHLILVSYNGDSFDIPFLKTVSGQYGRRDPFGGCISFDLYREAKKYRKLMQLENLKRKTVEKFCGVEREDPYTGDELISVYEEYLRRTSLSADSCEDTERNRSLKEKCLGCLLLHNGEDLEDMLPVMSILGYRSLMEGEFVQTDASVTQNAEHRILDLKFRLRTPLPRELYRECSEYVLSVSGEDPLKMKVCVPVISGEKKLFFTSFQEYYYLPVEDMAIHRSVGIYMDRSHRIPATKQNCYIRETGDYLPVPEGFACTESILRDSWNGKGFIRFTPDLLKREEELKAYVKALLAGL